MLLSLLTTMETKIPRTEDKETLQYTCVTIHALRKRNALYRNVKIATHWGAYQYISHDETLSLRWMNDR